MKIYREIPEATKPERAWVVAEDLLIDYHLWNQDAFYYIDRHTEIPIKEIIELRMKYGPRNGFKGMYFIYGRDFRVFELSENHKEVIVQIYKALKGKVKIQKEVVTNDKETN